MSQALQRIEQTREALVDALAERNWTAIGLPDCAELPIVDPRGLLTPFLDGWSLDSWVMPQQGECLLPSRSLQCQQQLQLAGNVSINTKTTLRGMRSGWPVGSIPWCSASPKFWAR